MTLPLFNPGVNPSFQVPWSQEWPVSTIKPVKPYDVVMPSTVNPVSTFQFQYPGLTAAQKEWISSFFRRIGGPSGAFEMRPLDPIDSPLDGGLVLDQIADAGAPAEQRTYYVRFAWYDAVSGEETMASPAEAITIASGSLLVVSIPTFPVGVDSWRVYASETEGEECLQGASSASSWTESVSGLVTLSARPRATNNLKPLLKWRLAEGLQWTKTRAGRFSLAMTLAEVWV